MSVIMYSIAMVMPVSIVMVVCLVCCMLCMMVSSMMTMVYTCGLAASSSVTIRRSNSCNCSGRRMYYALLFATDALLQTLLCQPLPITVHPQHIECRQQRCVGVCKCNQCRVALWTAPKDVRHDR